MFGGEIETLAGAVLEAAAAQGVMITTAESCTGGMIAAALTAVPGSSRVMERGFITYSNEAKVEMLGVDPASVAAHGAVSPQVAQAMAQGALNRSRAGLAVSVTGIAGPGGSEHKPEGRVCFGLASAGEAPRSVTRDFGAIGRENVRRESVMQALRMLEGGVSG